MIDDEELYRLFYDELQDADKFIEYLNKKIFDYIQAKRKNAMEMGAWDSSNMWFEPNKKFLEWFELKGIDLESESSGIPDFLSKWAKEVVNLLKEHGEMKNNDIIIALNRRGMTASYHHISQIFKSESDRKFYKEELVNNGSYFSLKTAK